MSESNKAQIELWDGQVGEKWAAMQVSLRMGRRQSEKFHTVCVFEDAESFRVSVSYCWRDFGWTEHDTLEQSSIKLAL